MISARRFVAENLEKISVLLILIGIGVTHFFVQDKLPFLSFYYLPVLLAAWGCGRRTALLVSILAVLAVGLYAVATPANFDQKIAEKMEERDALQGKGAATEQVAAVEEQIANRRFDIHFSLIESPFPL